MRPRPAVLVVAAASTLAQLTACTAAPEEPAPLHGSVVGKIASGGDCAHPVTATAATPQPTPSCSPDRFELRVDPGDGAVRTVAVSRTEYDVADIGAYYDAARAEPT